MKHVNIPVFIPHLGCPQTCVFCDQRNITGKKQIDFDSIDSRITSVLSSVDKKNTETEIAFFGGSFTGIDRKDMLFLLNTAQKYVDSGEVDSIRLSTRPDYIDDEILTLLKNYKVKTIELGIQSMADDVLRASARGYTAARAEKACMDILKAGFSLVGQMMIGLPLSGSVHELHTAIRLCDIGISAARIYPTVVLYETELQRMTERGLYKPLTVDEAVKRSCDVLEIFVGRKTPVIRIGLCASDNLNGSSFYSGAYHPAIGEMTENALFLKRLRRSFSAFKTEQLNGGDYTVYCPVRSASKVTGQKKRNINFILNEFNVNNIKIIETDIIEGYNIIVLPSGQSL